MFTIFAIGIVLFLIAAFIAGFINLHIIHQRLKKQGFDIKQRTPVGTYLGGHPEIEGPKDWALIYPTDESLFIVHYPNLNLTQTPKILGEIRKNAIIAIRVSEPANFLLIDWKKEGAVYQAVFQNKDSSVQTTKEVKNKLSGMIGHP